MRNRSQPKSFEHQLVKTSVTLSLVPTIIMLFLLYQAGLSVYLKVIIILFAFAAIGIGHLLIFRRIRNQLRSTTNLVEALITGDSSMRPNSAVNQGALSELNQVINIAAERLAEQRLVSKEHHIAMSKVLEHINIAVICLDDKARVHLINPKAKQLFNMLDDAIGLPAKTLGIDQSILSQQLQQVVSLTVNKVHKRVFLQTDHYQLHGRNHRLLFFNDVQKLLQNEEREAWQRLLRVLSHEINNSLAPIASIGESLSMLVDNNQTNIQKHEALTEGLNIMTKRALSLNNFIKEYQSLTRLPAPSKQLFNLKVFIQEQLSLFTNIQTRITTSEDIEIYADPDQLAQVMVNLIKNSEQAVPPEQTCQLALSWRLCHGVVQVLLEDNGPGICNPENLFVPFYTTKQNGNGIGLVVSRQILFNHGGDLSLNNADKGTGAVATLSLPA